MSEWSSECVFNDYLGFVSSSVTVRMKIAGALVEGGKEGST